MKHRASEPARPTAKLALAPGESHCRGAIA